MDFFEKLRNYEPEPPRREKTPEELMEEKIRALMADPDVHKIVEDMLDKIKRNCMQAAERGEKRLCGFLRGYSSDWYDKDGYSHPREYYSRFYPWENGVRQTTERITFDFQNLYQTNIYAYDLWEDQQAILRMLTDRMREEGFPDGVLSAACHTIEWRMKEGVPESARQGWGKYTAQYTDSYVIEVDIRW